MKLYSESRGCLPPELVHVHITAIWADGSISGKLGNECHSFQSQAALLALPKFHVVDSPQLPISFGSCSEDRKK